MKPKKVFYYVILPFVSLVFIDQLSKYFISVNIDNLPVNIIGTYLRFVYGENRYAIFGISFGSNILHFILPTFALLLVIYLIYRYRKFPKLVVPLSIILGGGVSNLLDRVIRGFVIDFIDMGIGGCRWYTYNFADAFTLLSIIYLLVYDIFGTKKTKEKEKKKS